MVETKERASNRAPVGRFPRLELKSTVRPRALYPGRSVKRYPFLPAGCHVDGYYGQLVHAYEANNA